MKLCLSYVRYGRLTYWLTFDSTYQLTFSTAKGNVSCISTFKGNVSCISTFKGNVTDFFTFPHLDFCICWPSQFCQIKKPSMVSDTGQGRFVTRKPLVPAIIHDICYSKNGKLLVKPWDWCRKCGTNALNWVEGRSVIAKDSDNISLRMAKVNLLKHCENPFKVKQQDLKLS